MLASVLWSAFGALTSHPLLSVWAWSVICVWRLSHPVIRLPQCKVQYLWLAQDWTLLCFNQARRRSLWERYDGCTHLLYLIYHLGVSWAGAHGNAIISCSAYLKYPSCSMQNIAWLISVGFFWNAQSVLFDVLVLLLLLLCIHTSSGVTMWP